MVIKQLLGMVFGIWLLISSLVSPVWAADLPIAAPPTGAQLFVAQCAGCHGGGGNIIRRGKNLKLNTLQKNQMDTPEAIAAIVTQGKGIMSSYAKKMTVAEIADVSAYVLEQAKSGWKS
jgi:cytochrome c6